MCPVKGVHFMDGREVEFGLKDWDDVIPIWLEVSGVYVQWFDILSSISMCDRVRGLSHHVEKPC